MVALWLSIMSVLFIYFISFLLNTSEDVSLFVFLPLPVHFKCLLCFHCGPHRHGGILATASLDALRAKAPFIPVAMHTKRYTNIVII